MYAITSESIVVDGHVCIYLLIKFIVITIKVLGTLVTGYVCSIMSLKIYTKNSL